MREIMDFKEGRNFRDFPFEKADYSEQVGKSSL